MENRSTLVWDKPDYLLDGKRFVPQIFDGNPGEPIPEGFNAAKIMLNGRMSSELQWDAARKEAQELSNKGLKIFWEIDLGLFSGLTLSLANQTQYAALGIAIDHFRDTLFVEFGRETIGICLYRGSADFSLGFEWSQEQLVHLQQWLQQAFQNPETFFRETAIPLTHFQQLDEKALKANKIGRHLLRLFCTTIRMKYLDLLIINLPDALQPFLLLNVEGIDEDFAGFAQLLSKERFERWHCALRGGDLPHQELSWDCAKSPFGYLGHQRLSIPETEEVKVGVCLPLEQMISPCCDEGLNEVLKKLLERKIPFRIIPETFLITEWDRLDYLIVLSQGISIQGRRKLQGFCAAGGTVVTIGPSLEMPLEMTVEEFL